LFCFAGSSTLITNAVFFSAGGEGSVDMVEMALRMASEPQEGGMFMLTVFIKLFYLYPLIFLHR